MPGFEVVGKEERDAVLEIFDKDNGVLFAHGFDARRNGNFRVREMEKEFAAHFGAKHAVAVSSGSTALLVALWALGVRAGDEVITQSFTFVATVEAIMMLGAVPVITEIDETYAMDPLDLEAKITSKTKAIIPVHMAGNPANMKAIMKIAKSKNIKVLEDCAQSIGSTLDAKAMGTWGDVGSFSLDFGKTITSGEGGIVLTNDTEIFNEALAYHDHGHEYNPTVGRAEDTRHNWGFNFRMNEMNAAVGRVQLKKLDSILERSKHNRDIVLDHLRKFSKLKFRTLVPGAIDNADAIYVILPNKEMTDACLKRMSEQGLATKNVPDALRWHFAPLWEHMFNENHYYKTNYKTAWPKSSALLERTVALPVMVNWDEAFMSSYLQKLSLVFDF